MIATTPLVDDLLAAGAPVALGISGGKDSAVLADATLTELDARGHIGPRILVYSDLGRAVWGDARPTCERLANHLSVELLVVKRQAGDLVDRWLVRWSNNVARYANLECVKLILPWSTPGMRFCTSELKTSIICRGLIGRFPGQTILSAAGLRRDESSQRAKALIAKEQPKLTSKKHGTSGYDWHPILGWTLAEVKAHIVARNLPQPAAYDWGLSRYSCVFCIMSSGPDLAAAALAPETEDLYRELVDLEISSTFSFQGGWLGDVAPQRLTAAQQQGLAEAKRRAAERERIEAQIPPHLLYTAGWPTVMPSLAEAARLAQIRRDVAKVLNLPIRYTDALSVHERYAELIVARPATVLALPSQTRMEVAA